jgi:hypothetical protein
MPESNAGKAQKVCDQVSDSSCYHKRHVVLRILLIEMEEAFKVASRPEAMELLATVRGAHDRYFDQKLAFCGGEK